MPEIQYPKNPNSDTAFVVQEDGTKNRALMTAPQDTSTLELPSNANSTKGYVTIDGKKQRVILTADIGSGGGGGSSYTAGNGISIDANNEISVAAPTLVNTATSANGITIYGTPVTGSSAGINIGKNSVAGLDAFALGHGAEATGQNSIAIGPLNTATGGGAIQLGGIRCNNSDYNTLKVGNANGNFEMMSSDGTIPFDRLVKVAIQYSSVPTASVTNVDKIIQYVGTTDGTYTNGYFYKCSATTPASVTATQTDGSSLSDITVDLPTYQSQLRNPNANETNNFRYSSWGSWINRNTGVEVGASLSDYGISYTGTPTTDDNIQVVYTAPAYGWTQVDVQPSSSTLTPNFNRVKFNGLSTLQSRDYYIDVSSQYYLRIGASSSQTVNDLLIRADSGVKTIAFSSSGGVLGSASGKFACVHTEKLHNSADIAVPTTGGTMAVIGVNTTATLAVADWSSNTQTVTVSGVKADSVVFVSPAPASASDYASAGILCTSQGADSLTFSCTQTPSSAIVVNIVCM